MGIFVDKLPVAKRDAPTRAPRDLGVMSYYDDRMTFSHKSFE
jgi:hypothetical protein